MRFYVVNIVFFNVIFDKKTVFEVPHISCHKKIKLKSTNAKERLNCICSGFICGFATLVSINVILFC
jgi:hypothetical protein